VRVKAFNHNFSKVLTKREQNPRNRAPSINTYIKFHDMVVPVVISVL